ncbi:GNAT family N-acetyltransferase [Macrococcus carouselicus]|uniref:GNAT family N-acetyltransferase n=1 Tax=Macrococcus carouselicus TaxID=69969 RepID=A0A9Q8CJ74_9STAP|nr:GNAT family N-acetyltransferase [Macrococcus carouselicus]TDL96604.1 GNAT family N-acetyltransferase [Macrococcus carouselicus]
MYSIDFMTTAEQNQICQWHYDRPYDTYNMTPGDFSSDSLFYSVKDGTEIIGMLKLYYNEGTCSLGLGMRPDLTGQGKGLEFVQSAIQFIEEQGSSLIQLAVATSNVRAIKVYTRCGFEETDYELMLAGDGLEEFVKMEYRL